MLLEPYRVLDFTRGRGAIGPMILADLGADVVRVEWPGAPEPLDANPYLFAAYNRNKRSVNFDPADSASCEALLQLVARADFVFENGSPGEMAALGLGFERCRAANPSIVYVATTPFGQDGPYAGHASSDLTLAAMGGMMALNGDADRPPVRITVPQTWLHAAAESAVAALVAHFRRLHTGEAQFADVSVQAATFWTGLNAMIASAIQGKDIERAGTLLQLGVQDLPLVHAAADGDVVMVPTGATMGGLIDQMVADGIVPETWKTDEDWRTYDLRFLTGQPIHFTIEEAVAAIRKFTANGTKADLFHWGLSHGVTIAPVTTTADVLTFDHLGERSYWHKAGIDGKTVRLPGPFVRPADTPLSIRRPAPEPGAHTAEVKAEWAASPRAHVERDGAPNALPFEGLKVADFSWIGVGPITAKYLADHGATVVRIEAGNPVDRLRGAGPHKDGISGTNRSQFYGAFNTSKYGLSLDLKHPQGKAIALRLLEWADVALESFTPGTMGELGLGYDAASARNPGLVMVSSCLMGQTGPAAKLAGYGYHAAAISGFYEVTGWGDRPPGGPFNAYTDVIAPHFLASTVMAALDYRRRTGTGQYIEQAQMESALHFLAPELIATQITGETPRRAGNDSPYFAPHAAYPCAGDDEWVAIAVETDAQWAALRRALGDPEWARDQKFDSVAGRMAGREVIDAGISDFTRQRDKHEVMAKLQAAGVPAGAVQRSHDLLKDPQLAHRKFFHPLEHPEMGLVPYEGHMFSIKGYESGPRMPAPCLGEHNATVLLELLGMSDDEFAAAIESGALGA